MDGWLDEKQQQQQQQQKKNNRRLMNYWNSRLMFSRVYYEMVLVVLGCVQYPVSRHCTIMQTRLLYLLHSRCVIIIPTDLLVQCLWPPSASFSTDMSAVRQNCVFSCHILHNGFFIFITGEPKIGKTYCNQKILVIIIICLLIRFRQFYSQVIKKNYF